MTRTWPGSPRSLRSLGDVLALLFIGSLVACSEKSKPAPAKVEAAVDPDASLSANQKLALAKLTSAGGADDEVTAAQKSVRDNMQKDDLWVTLGRAWIRKARESNDPGFYLNADACAAVVLEREPGNPLALNLRGLVHLNDHRFEDARDVAQKILTKRADDPMAWGTLSDALLEMGRYDEAIEATQKMIDLKPNLPSYSRASHLQWMRGDVGHAKQTVRNALDAGRAAKRDPEPGAWVLVQAAMIFWHEGDYGGADAGFDKALERLREYPPALVGKGRVAMANGEAKRAADYFARAYATSPLPETAWLLGDAKKAAGDAEGAAQAYANVEKDGRRTDPRTLSLFLSTKKQNADDALALAREEYTKRKDVYTEDALAWALYRAGKLDEAKASIARARRLGTPDARLVYHEGAIRIATGDVAKGRELVQKALKMNRAFDAVAAKEATELLAEKIAAR
jgi:tetratricopeptide (TPR) repeat protein